MNHPNITVFGCERDCGLAEAIQSQNSVAFVTSLEPVTEEFQKQIDLDDPLVKAGLSDPDVYHLYSILVTSSWNRNDDIFHKDEVWAARNTPRFKPTNIEHDEKQLVGGIINSWPVDANMKVIPDDTTDLPDLYHILVSSIIYRQWKDPELKARVDNLIQQIEAGDKYVSMECIFRGFDYGVVDLEGKHHQIPRNESTAFLTQHLRAYGGDGTYQKHRVGRLLRNITFIGKGFVDRPANPDSIIFEKDHIFSFTDVQKTESLFLDKNGVNNNEEDKTSSIFEHNDEQEIYIMSVEVLNEQIKELKDNLASAKAENKELNDKLSEANITAYETKVKELNEEVAKLNDTVSELENQLEKAKEKGDSLETSLKEKTEALAEAKKHLDEKEKEEKRKERKEKMGKAGLSDEEIEARFDKLVDLTDEQFDAVIDTLVAMKPTESESESEEDNESDNESEDDVDASSVVDEESTEEGSGEGAASSEEDADEISVAREALQKWVKQCIMNEKPE